MIGIFELTFMRQISIELIDDNGFAQPLYYDLEYGERGTSYFTLHPDESSTTIKLKAEAGGRHLWGTPNTVANREAYRLRVPAQISRGSITKLSDPTSSFAHLISQLLDAHFADNFNECDGLEIKINEHLLEAVEYTFPDSAETFWVNFMQEVNGEILLIIPDLPVISITKSASNSELELIANELESSKTWMSRENYVIDTTFSFLTEMRDRLLDAAEMEI
jgi:hypothetical protein